MRLWLWIALLAGVAFAQQTPVPMDLNPVPGFGRFTARVIFYNGTRAGTLFGKIVKNEPAAPRPQ